MSLLRLVDELLSEMIALVASDIRSLKSLTLVNRQLCIIGRAKLFAQFYLHIRSRAFPMMGAFRPIKGRAPPDLIALLDTSPKLANLVRRVRLSKNYLTDHDPRLPHALEKLVNIQYFEISWGPGHEFAWTDIPQSMQNSLLTSVFPRLTSLVMTSSILNLPSNLLDHTPLLSFFSSPSYLESYSEPVLNHHSASARFLPPLQHLFAGRHYFSTSPPKSQGSILTLIKGRVDENVHLTFEYADLLSLQLLDDWLGKCVRHLTIMYLADTIIPFSRLPCLETLTIEIKYRAYQVDDPSAHANPGV
ncbi:hypothetical protein DL96DRAFT_1824341 [Flagelloscypha sp. PMI_526]|nr:hypothetical protein DL96DRAFT_1824341 [Flagelloscypha sp. PMI_526]